jgi:putative transposase
MIGKAPGKRSIRLKGYDYAQPGAYFVTICTYRQGCLFGEVSEGEMALNEFGKVVEEEWYTTAQLRPYVELDAHVIMPNHFHGVLLIVGDGRGTARRAPTCERFGKPVAGSLPTVVGAFKAAVTRRINRMRDTPGAPVWQRNYLDNVKLPPPGDLRSPTSPAGGIPRQAIETAILPPLRGGS